VAEAFELKQTVDCQPVIRHSCLAGCETTSKSAPKYGSLECFSSVSREFLESFSSESRAILERYSSDTRAILERYSSDTRDLSDTSPVHLRSGLEGDSCLLEREGTQIANSAKSISARSYQIVRSFARSYQFLPN